MTGDEINNAADVALRQALYLSKENKKAEPKMKRVFLFPPFDICRILEVFPDDDCIPSLVWREWTEEQVGDHKNVECRVLVPEAVAFYFPEDAENPETPLATGIAMISESESAAKITPPEGWGKWEEALDLSEEREIE